MGEVPLYVGRWGSCPLSVGVPSHTIWTGRTRMRTEDANDFVEQKGRPSFPGDGGICAALSRSCSNIAFGGIHARLPCWC